MSTLRGISVALSTLLLCAGGLVLGPPNAQAHTHEGRSWRPPVVQPLVTVTVQSGHGGALPSVQHHGKTFVAGERGDRYEIRLTNNTSSRVEVVVSVDGRDVVSGRAGDFTSQRGYVLEPFGSAVIDGFRLSLDEVAAFRFSDVHSSFAAKVGAPQNAGVIGIAAFKEKARPMVHHHRPHAAPESAAPSAPSRGRKNKGAARPGAADLDASASPRGGASGSRSHGHTPMPSNELGTEFAEQRHSRVREVAFERANARRPDFRTVIHYDSVRGLEARGVPIRPEPVMAHPVRPTPPDAWPAARDTTRFSQPPPGWRG